MYSWHFSCFSHELFTFAVEQVQVAVFRECDFRGRKLLFDSKSVERVSSDTKNNVKNERKSSCEQSSEFVEITNGFGYSVSKLNFYYCLIMQIYFTPYRAHAHQ